MLQVNLPNIANFITEEMNANLVAIWQDIAESTFTSMHITPATNKEKWDFIQTVYPTLKGKLPYANIPQWDQINNLQMAKAVAYLMDLSQQFLAYVIEEFEWSDQQMSIIDLVTFRVVLVKSMIQLTNHPKFQMMERKKDLDVFKNMDQDMLKNIDASKYSTH